MHDLAHVYHFQVKEHHLDTFGHVNNATYLELFEEARWDWITANGYGMEKIASSGLGPIVLEINIAFKRELRLRQQIKIETFLARTKTKISTVRQNMLTPEGKLCCEAVFTFGLFDTRNRRLVQPTEEWLSAISKPLAGASVGQA